MGMSNSLFGGKNFALEIKADGIVRKWTECIENVKCISSASNEVIHVFDEGKGEIDKLMKQAATTEDKNMLLAELEKLMEAKKKKLDMLKEIKVETPNLFNKPKGAAVQADVEKAPAEKDDRVVATAAKQSHRK